MSLFEHYLLLTEDKATDLQESVHAVGFGIGQVLRKNITIEDLLNPDLFREGFDKWTDMSGVSVDELFEWINKNPDWAKSIVTSVNAGRNSKYLKGNKYTFSRAKGMMNIVYAQYQKLKLKEKIPLGNDKWNPGDIWASTINALPKDFESIGEYNDFISKALKKGILVGISLKKVGGSAKVVLQTNKEDWTPIEYKVIKKPRDIYPTGMNIVTSSKEKLLLQFRSFIIVKQADITGELVQPTGSARHGKVPADLKNKYIKQFNIPQMPKSKIKQLAKDLSLTELRQMVVQLWKDAGYTFSEKQIEKAWEKRFTQLQDDVGYFQSIIHSLEIAAFLNTHRSVADQIVNDWFKGAKSITDVSSDFIKIY